MMGVRRLSVPSPPTWFLGKRQASGGKGGTGAGSGGREEGWRGRLKHATAVAGEMCADLGLQLEIDLVQVVQDVQQLCLRFGVAHDGVAVIMRLGVLRVHGSDLDVLSQRLGLERDVQEEATFAHRCLVQVRGRSLLQSRRRAFQTAAEVSAKPRGRDVVEWTRA